MIFIRIFYFYIIRSVSVTYLFFESLEVSFLVMECQLQL